MWTYNQTVQNTGYLEHKKHKYIDKIPLGNNKYRYVYYESNNKNRNSSGVSITRENDNTFAMLLDGIFGTSLSNKVLDKKLNKKTEKFSYEEDIKAVNPNYSPDSLDYSTNCGYCSIAYDLRKRGYDVTAKPNPGGKNPFLYSDFYNCYEDAKLVTANDIVKRNKIKKNNKKVSPKAFAPAMEKELISQGDGARGIIVLEWSQGGGHAINYEVHKGQLKMIDTQNPSRTKDRNLLDYCNRVSNIGYIRTDNLKPKEGCLDFVKNRKKKKGDK